jgi:hypothetical protein
LQCCCAAKISRIAVFEPKTAQSNISPIRFLSPEATKMIETEKPQQQRYFCENCEREVFLQSKYCDKCGGEIKWPEEIKKVLALWAKKAKAKP